MSEPMTLIEIFAAGCLRYAISGSAVTMSVARQAGLVDRNWITTPIGAELLERDDVRQLDEKISNLSRDIELLRAERNGRGIQ